MNNDKSEKFFDKYQPWIFRLIAAGSIIWAVTKIDSYSGGHPILFVFLGYLIWGAAAGYAIYATSVFWVGVIHTLLGKNDR
jgi:hypothetical protein